MWLGCHEFPNEIDPMMSSSLMLNLDVGMMPIILPVGTCWVVLFYMCVFVFSIIKVQPNLLLKIMTLFRHCSPGLLQEIKVHQGCEKLYHLISSTEFKYLVVNTSENCPCKLRRPQELFYVYTLRNFLQLARMAQTCVAIKLYYMYIGNLYRVHHQKVAIAHGWNDSSFMLASIEVGVINIITI